MISSRQNQIAAASFVLLLAATIGFTATATDTVNSEVTDQAMLTTMVQAATSSRGYATALIGAAGIRGLSTGSLQSNITSGDALLAQAKADLSSETNQASGIVAAEGAMAEYTYAGTEASLALQRARMTSSLDLDATSGAVAGLNATAIVIATAAAQVCSGTGVATSELTLLQKDCASLHAQLGNATAELVQTLGVVAQLRANATGSATISEATDLVAEARTGVKAASADLAGLSSFTYSQRGQSYYSSVLIPLFNEANATIATQKAALAGYVSAQSSFASSMNIQDSASSNLSALASSVESVDTSSVSLASVGALAAASKVQGNLSGLLALVTPLAGSAGLVASIGQAESSASAFTTSVGTADAASVAFSSTSISGFSSYLTTMISDYSDVQTSGNSYTSSFVGVQADISALITALGVLAPPALLTYNSTFTNLRAEISSSGQTMTSALHAEVASMSEVQAGLTGAESVLLSSVAPSPSTIQIVLAASNSEAVFLNSTAEASLEAAASSIQSDAQASSAYAASIQSALSGTIGQFGSSAGGLASQGASLASLTSATASAMAAAHSAIASDIQSRTSQVASANLEVAQSANYFDSQDVGAGVSSLVRAYADLEVAVHAYA